MKALFGWLGRKTALFLILVVAVAFSVLVWPNLRLSRSAYAFSEELMSPAQVKAELVSARADTQQRLGR